LLDRRFSVAPMMDWTDRHCRMFHRILSPSALLYTEMVTTGALIHGDVARHLSFNTGEHPVALQLGGSDPTDLATCTKLAEEYGYDEVNLNVGCPSDRVQSGRFGACLMAEPETVAASVKAMMAATSLPVTVKSRIGIDDQEDYADLKNFVTQVVDAGCPSLTIHARKAWLKGLSPKENRDIPPLKYDLVYQIKEEFPATEIIINGGIKTVADIKTHLQHVDGVMVGREAYSNPSLLLQVEQNLFGGVPQTAEQALVSYRPYIEEQLATGIPLKSITRHILGLFNGRKGAKKFRRVLSEKAHLPGVGIDLLDEAMAQVQPAA